MKSDEDAWTSLLEENNKNNRVFAYVENDPALPNVLLYGDSISIGYTTGVRENLKGKANVYRNNHPDIVIDDLHAFTKPHQPQWWQAPGDVHYNPDGRKAQGDEVARVIINALAQRRDSARKRTGLILYSDDLTHIASCVSLSL